MTRPAHAADREARLRRSLKRLGVDASTLPKPARGRWDIRKEGSKVDESAGLDLGGVDQGEGEAIAVL